VGKEFIAMLGRNRGRKGRFREQHPCTIFMVLTTPSGLYKEQTKEEQKPKTQ
jgi:hypothetical protein